ncbi:MAG: regulatory protein [Ilumatobacteraceae bacterium]|nr:regulatory protein [Ilumatobacteraceae bacterium]
MSIRDEPACEPDVSVTFHHDVTAPQQARRAIRPLVSAEGDPIADAVQMVTSELVSNVVQHTSDGGTVKAWDPKPDKPFRLEVADSEPVEPKSPEVATPEGGRGLRIVDAMSDVWGVDVDPGGAGKTVWAEFNRP